MWVGLLLIMAATAAAQPSAGFVGTWVLKSAGQPVFKLTLDSSFKGALTKPSSLTIDQDGDINRIGGEPITLPVQKAKMSAGELQLTIDDDRFTMTLDGPDRATLALSGMRPWKLERVPDGTAVVLATSLPQPDYSPEIRVLREQLTALIKEDQDARFAFDDARMKAADEKSRPEVLRIFEKYGWPPASLIGKDAAHDFWLLVQHQTPEIQQRMLPAMEKVAKAGEASMSDYAYLYDRVQMGLGKPQHWGSQAQCRGGKPALWPVDDPAGLDQRRKELFMMPIEEYLKAEYLVKACAGAAK